MRQQLFRKEAVQEIGKLVSFSKKLRDKESVTSFPLPGDHWMYSLMSLGNSLFACDLATSNFFVICFLFSSTENFFERFNHLALVVLSVIERIQSNGCILLSIWSGQGPSVEAVPAC